MNGDAENDPGAQSGDSIWAMQGTYYAPVVLRNGVKLLGGFAGTETLASQSNPATRVTIINGGGSQRCVESRDCGASTVLRGFKIMNGQWGDDYDEGGGGLYVENSSVQIVRCIFENNQAVRFGGAVSIRGSGSPEFVNCDFHSNGTGSGTSVQPLAGGGVFLHSGVPKFTNCLFYNNKAGEGTGLANFKGSATIVNCTFANNQATIGSGGGVFDAQGAVTIKNSIFWGNTATRAGNQIFNGTDITSPVTYSNVQGGYAGSGNINSDPYFMNVGQNDYRISCESSSRDVGLNSAVPADIVDLDLDGNLTEQIPRDLGWSSRFSGTVDLGAYEVQGLTCLD
jgi:hypothetical protein